MTNLVPPSEIEQIVGIARHATDHYARAVSIEETVYILHSQVCFDTVPDLRDCPYSLALDDGIDIRDWAGMENAPVQVAVVDGWLVPAGR